MKHRQVEICCGSYYDAIQAYEGGAKRIELNSALHLGGLTPSLATLKLTKKNTNVKVLCMIRVRGGGFCYLEEDYRAMKEDARLVLEHGADGIVFGFLDEQAHIDVKKTLEFTQLAKQFGKEAVFHRAFDIVKDPYRAIEQLIELKIDRILTSGQQEQAMDGRELLKELQYMYGKQIELVAGSGLQEHNVQEFLHFTKFQQVHSSCKSWRYDPTTSIKNVDFGYMQGEYHSSYEIVDKRKVKTFITAVTNCK